MEKIEICYAGGSAVSLVLLLISFQPVESSHQYGYQLSQMFLLHLLSSATGATWRSSQGFIIFTAILGLFSETFLFAFIVPILSFMVEIRLELPANQTQWITTALLASYGVVGIVFSPIIAHFADKTPNRRTPLLIALIGCLIGTGLLAWCPSVWMMFVGRIVQSISSSGGWLVCFATLTDHVSSDHLGRILGIAMSFVTAGIVIAPVLAGILLQVAGYWAAWSAPLLLLALGLVSRSIMLERHGNEKIAASDAEEATDEEASLLREQQSDDHTKDPSISLSFYRIFLSDIRVLVGLGNIFGFALVLSSFDTTLPLHLSRTFHWGPSLVGTIFLAIQTPRLIFGPIVGWLRDSIGLRYPTTVGWILMAGFLWLLGVPGSGFEENPIKIDGQALFIVAMIGVGIAVPLVVGGGTFQLVAIMKDLEAEKPLIFGPHGATSRMFSLTEVAMNLGTTVGPLVSGALVEVLNFQYMVGALGLFCLVIAVASFATFTHKSLRREG